MTLLNNSFTIEISLKEDLYLKEPNLSAWVSWTYFGDKNFSRYYQECTQILAWHLSFGVDRLALVQEQQHSEGTLIIMNICLSFIAITHIILLQWIIGSIKWLSWSLRCSGDEKDILIISMIFFSFCRYFIWVHFGLHQSGLSVSSLTSLQSVSFCWLKR